MSDFKNKTITVKGLELLSKAIAGKKLEFTKMVMGNGNYSGDIGLIQDLVSVKQNINIKSISRSGSQVNLSGSLTQTDIKEDFYWSELGVYARGNDGVEILYLYANAKECSYISANMINEKLINVGVIVSSAQQVTAVINSSLIYATQKDIEQHDNSETAHKDLRKQINDCLVQATKDKLGMVKVGDNLTITKEGELNGAAPYTHPNDANTRHVTDAQINTWNNKAPAHDHPYIPTSASCNKNWNWNGQGGQPTWLWGGNDPSNMFVYNPTNFNVNYANNAGNANTIGGLTLEQIKDLISKKGGDIMGKTFKFEEISVKWNNTVEWQTIKEFYNNNGGMVRMSLRDYYGYTSIKYRITVDGNIVFSGSPTTLFVANSHSSNSSASATGGFFDLPFKQQFKIEAQTINTDTFIQATFMYYLP